MPNSSHLHNEDHELWQTTGPSPNATPPLGQREPTTWSEASSSQQSSNHNGWVDNTPHHWNARMAGMSQTAPCQFIPMPPPFCYNNNLVPYPPSMVEVMSQQIPEYLAQHSATSSSISVSDPTTSIYIAPTMQQRRLTERTNRLKRTVEDMEVHLGRLSTQNTDLHDRMATVTSTSESCSDRGYDFSMPWHYILL